MLQCLPLPKEEVSLELHKLLTLKFRINRCPLDNLGYISPMKSSLHPLNSTDLSRNEMHDLNHNER
jgi:hypothetical protein